MKQKMTVYMLMLCVLLVVTMPTQVFASTNNTGNNSCVRQASANAARLSCNFRNANVNGFGNVNVNQLRNHILNNLCNRMGFNCAPNVNRPPQNQDTGQSGPCVQAPVVPETPEVNHPPVPPVTPTPPVAPAPPTAPGNNAALNDFERQVVALVNQERQAAGLAPLRVNARLSEMARAKAADMRDNNYFSHNSPVYGSPFDMMRTFGIRFTSAGENIARGQQSPESVMRAWMNSPGHRANILDPRYDQIGVGFVQGSRGATYWVQAFIRT